MDMHAGMMESAAKAPTQPPTALQSRIESELQMHLEVASQRRDGGPDDMGEIDRELTIVTGAFEGVYQRLGFLAAQLGPIMPGDTHSRLLASRDDRHDRPDSFDVSTEVGQRIHTIGRRLSELEEALGLLANSVRL